VDRHCFDDDPTFNFDADSDPDSILCVTYVGQSDFFYTLIYNNGSLYWCLSLQCYGFHNFQYFGQHIEKNRVYIFTFVCKMYTGPAPDTDRYALYAEVRVHNTKYRAGHFIFHCESNLFLDAPIPEKYF
jgi:hypothetical protein